MAKVTTKELAKVATTAIRELRTFTNPERQKATLNYFPSAMENLGVAVPDIRKVARAINKETKPWEAADMFALSLAIIGKNTLEGRQLAYELYTLRPVLREFLTKKALEELGKGMDNWTSVDVFSTSIAGQLWRAGTLKDADLMRWSRSKDKWWRRASLASTIPLNMPSRGGSGDTARTMKLCTALCADQDEMVAKGLSWALRALIPTDPTAVEDFLAEHDEVLAARVKREVRNKLNTGRKSGK
jgi:3-methyladenine DNA glycosylase AlkD